MSGTIRAAFRGIDAEGTSLEDVATPLSVRTEPAAA